MGFITPAKSRAPLWTLWRNRMMKDVTMLPTTIWDIYRICCFEPFSWLCGLCVQFCCASNLSVGQMMNWVMWIGIKLESAKPEMSNDVQRWVLLAWVLHWYSNSEIPPASQSWPLISGHTLCRAAWTAPVGRKREIWKLETQLVKIDRTLWNLELVYNRIYIYISWNLYTYIYRYIILVYACDTCEKNNILLTKPASLWDGDRTGTSWLFAHWGACSWWLGTWCLSADNAILGKRLHTYTLWFP